MVAQLVVVHDCNLIGPRFHSWYWRFFCLSFLRTTANGGFSIKCLYVTVRGGIDPWGGVGGWGWALAGAQTTPPLQCVHLEVPTGILTFFMVNPPPPHSPSPSPQQHVSPPPFTPKDRTNMESPEETGQGEGETQGEVTGQGRPRLPKMVQSAEGGKRKDKWERIIVVVRSPCQESYPADAHTSAHKSVLESANPAWTVHLDAPGQRHRQQPVSGTADPGVVKQGMSSRGSVDTTKTCSDPHRVGMCSGERQIGAAKGKQTKTMASCQTLPPPPTQWVGYLGVEDFILKRQTPMYTWNYQTAYSFSLCGTPSPTSWFGDAPME